ncbi:MAG: hypothetical protein EXQ86_07520 [Rhodospirillales bacterium]|nr:hypothetical protein [Rhodospirillales bacterium]
MGDYVEKYIGKYAGRIGTEIKGVRGTITVTESGLAAALHRGGPNHVRDYFDWVSKKGMNSGDNQTEMTPWDSKVETRLREFERVPLRR